jgi:hypothetical protein
MKHLREFLPRLMVYTPACSEPLAEQALLDSAIEFCEKTLVIRKYLEYIPVMPGVNEYEVDLPSKQYDLSRVVSAALDSEAIGLTMADNRVFVTAHSGKPQSVTVMERECAVSLVFDKIPDDCYRLDLDVALKPARNATQLDDDLYDRWMDAVVAGALARLYMVPGQPFSDASAGIYQTGRAARLAVNAKIEGSYGRVRGTMAVKFRPFS